MSGKRKSHRDYQHRLVVLYPSLAFAVVGLIYLAGHLQSQVATNVLDFALLEAQTDRIAGDLDALTEAAVKDLEFTLQRAEGMPAPLSDTDLANLADESAYYGRLALVDATGERLSGVEGSSPPIAVFQELMVEAQGRMPILSGPVTGPTEDAPDQVYVLLPVLDTADQPRYVLVGELDMEEIWRRLDAGPNDVDAIIALGDSRHRVLLSPSDGPILGLNTSDVAESVVPAGRPVHADADSHFFIARQAREADDIVGPGWTVLMLKPYDSVRELVKRTSLYSTLTALVALGLVSLVGVKMHRRVYTPLGNAVKAAAGIAKGRLDVSVPEDGPMEIQKIAEAINHMVAEVRYHRHTLSNLVKTRTQSIEAARIALEQNMHQLQASYDSAQDAILIVDVHHDEILQANRQFAELFGLGDVDLVSLTGEDICTAMAEMFDDAADVQNRWRHYRTHPNSEGTEEWTLLKPQRRVLSVYTSPVRSSDDQTIIGRLWTFTDCTEQREQDEKLRQVQRMDAMGHLAGSLAHDFNNLLTVILGNLSIARSEVEAEDSRAYLEAAEEATGQATNLVKQLLGFSEHARLHLDTLDLNELVATAVEVLHHTADPRVVVVSEPADDLWTVPADKDQLQQVIMNLSVNALDAMPDGGQLTFRSENVRLEPGEFDMPPTSSGGEYVRIVVQDTGCGLPGHVRERMFEPFFTTKPDENSQGLGLAMAYGAISKHGGWITGDSAPETGARFCVYLQRTEHRRKAMKAENVSQGEMGQDPLILVVDDEAGVRRIATSVLKRGGFDTVEACDGEEAIQVYQERRSEIGAVLLDLSMPKLSGRETFVAMKQMDLSLPILICSGYPVDPTDFAAETGYIPDGIVDKPFNVVAIRDTVARVLRPVEAPQA